MFCKKKIKLMFELQLFFQQLQQQVIRIETEWVQGTKHAKLILKYKVNVDRTAESNRCRMN